MSNTVIKIENISKQYRLGTVGTGTLSHDLNRWWARVRGKDDPTLAVTEANDRAHSGTSDFVWALQDINLEVKQGDILGIIGRNGAGKSTLLKILSRVTAPTTGQIKVKGRIASLLEVGTGFHPELTGRENVYLNGAILGMTRKEITNRLDEIIDFSGCERFIDTPVKRYSSGMMVRLGFAVAAHLEPEILVVDEVLAVGDAEFQKKCLGKMQDVAHHGRTVLFVSHNMAAVSRLCRFGVALDDGKMICSKVSSEDAIAYYLDSIQSENASCHNTSLQPRETRGYISNIRFLEGQSSLSCGETLSVKITLTCRDHLNNASLYMTIYDCKQAPILHFNTPSREVYLKCSPGETEVVLHIPSLPLAPGQYSLNLSLVEDGKDMDQRQNILSFTVIESDFFGTGKIVNFKHCAFLLDHMWEYRSLGEGAE